MHRMGDVGGHDRHLACFEHEFNVTDGDGCFAIQDLHQSIPRCRVRAQSLARVESKQGNGMGFSLRQVLLTT